MHTRNVFREALIGYLEAGTPIATAYTLASIVLRTYLSGSLSPNSVADADRIREFLEKLGNAEAPLNLNLVLEPDSDGRLTLIPRPDCMKQHLPKDRSPTEEEVREAWRLCGG